MSDPFPTSAGARNRWVIARRPARNSLDPWKPYGFFVEEELAEHRRIVQVATVLLTNRECPWRCVMCDLWRNTLLETVPSGAIPAQIKYALNQLGPASQIKLYNSGSFFDLGAIPSADYPAIAAITRQFERVIVESHPSLVGDSCLRFRDLIDGRLEVAMGLETAYPDALERLNKRMTLEQFADAAGFLNRNGIALRVFVLVRPPFVPADEAERWVRRSVDFAFDCGATAISLIATRGGNGAMEALAAEGQFTPPTLACLESAAHFAIGCGRGRAFADLWDVQRIATCQQCAAARIGRLHRMNLTQVIPPSPRCDSCGA
jgi:radical SAM enzyme (TIGR01210 family)